MNYRKAPEPTPIVRVVATRAWEVVVPFAAAALLIVVGGFFMGGCGSRLTCDRAAKTCALTTLRGPGVPTHTKHIPIASIERATLASSGNLSGIALVYDGREDVLNGYSGETLANDATKRVWVDAVNVFLGDPSQARLDVTHGTFWLFWVAATLAAGCLGVATYAATRSRAVVHVDRDGRTVVFGRTKIEKVIGAQLREVDVPHDDGNSHKSGAVVILREEGEPMELVGLFMFSDAKLARFAARIDAAISGEG